MSQEVSEVSLNLLSWTSLLVCFLGLLLVPLVLEQALSPFSIGAICVSEFHKGCRRIGEFKGAVGLKAWRVRWMDFGNMEVYLQGNILLAV